MTQTFENEHIHLTINKHPGCKVNFSIKVHSKATKAAKHAAIKNVSKEVNIPGFRKGRAPEALVLQKYEPHVDKEFKDILVRNALNEAIQLSSIRPYSSEASMRMTKCEPLEGDSYLVDLEFESYPDIPEVDVNNLSLKSIEPKAVSEEDIGKRIEELRLHHAEWEEITDRPAEEGDFVILDIDILEDPILPLHQNSRFHMVEGKMPPWARNIVTGMKIKEAREGFSEPEDEASKEDFKPKKCRFILKRIQKANLPPVDDVLAKKAGVDTAEILRDRIIQSLQLEASRKIGNEMRQAMKKELAHHYAFDLPSERVKILHDDCHQVALQERDKFDSEEACNNYAHRLFDEAKDNIRLSYLIPKVVRDNNLPLPSPQEIQQRATEHLLNRYMSGSREALNDDDLVRLSQISESELITERALDFLIEKVGKE